MLLLFLFFFFLFFFFPPSPWHFYLLKPLKTDFIIYYFFIKPSGTAVPVNLETRGEKQLFFNFALRRKRVSFWIRGLFQTVVSCRNKLCLLPHRSCQEKWTPWLIQILPQPPMECWKGRMRPYFRRQKKAATPSWRGQWLFKCGANSLSVSNVRVNAAVGAYQCVQYKQYCFQYENKRYMNSNSNSAPALNRNLDEAKRSKVIFCFTSPRFASPIRVAAELKPLPATLKGEGWLTVKTCFLTLESS